MIKVSVFYPWSERAEFDMKYYLATYMPMVEARLGSACKGINVEQGIAGGSPGALVFHRHRPHPRRVAGSISGRHDSPREGDHG